MSSLSLLKTKIPYLFGIFFIIVFIYDFHVSLLLLSFFHSPLLPFFTTPSFDFLSCILPSSSMTSFCESVFLSRRGNIGYCYGNLCPSLYPPFQLSFFLWLHLCQSSLLYFYSFFFCSSLLPLRLLCFFSKHWLTDWHHLDTRNIFHRSCS